MGQAGVSTSGLDTRAPHKWHNVQYQLKSRELPKENALNLKPHRVRVTWKQGKKQSNSFHMSCQNKREKTSLVSESLTAQQSLHRRHLPQGPALLKLKETALASSFWYSKPEQQLSNLLGARLAYNKPIQPKMGWYPRNAQGCGTCSILLQNCSLRTAYSRYTDSTSHVVATHTAARKKKKKKITSPQGWWSILSEAALQNIWDPAHQKVALVR